MTSVLMVKRKQDILPATRFFTELYFLNGNRTGRDILSLSTARLTLFEVEVLNSMEELEHQ